MKARARSHLQAPPHICAQPVPGKCHPLQLRQQAVLAEAVDTSWGLSPQSPSGHVAVLTQGLPVQARRRQWVLRQNFSSQQICKYPKKPAFKSEALLQTPFLVGKAAAESRRYLPSRIPPCCPFGPLVSVEQEPWQKCVLAGSWASRVAQDRPLYLSGQPALVSLDAEDGGCF